MTAEEKAQAIKDLIWDRMDIEITCDPGDVEGVTDIDTFERIVDVERAIAEQSEIIYYSRAMEYLSKQDPSLHEALELADDLGYSPKDLSSEILATILNEQKTREIYWDLRDEIEEILQEDEPDEDEDIEGVAGVRVDNEWGANEMYLQVMNTESLYNKYRDYLFKHANTMYYKEYVKKYARMLQNDIKYGRIYLQPGMGHGEEARMKAGEDLYNAFNSEWLHSQVR